MSAGRTSWGVGCLDYRSPPNSSVALVFLLHHVDTCHRAPEQRLARGRRRAVHPPGTRRHETITGNSVAAKTYHSRDEFLDTVIKPFNARLTKPLVPTMRPLTHTTAALCIGLARAKKGDVTPAGEKLCAIIRKAANG